MKNRLTCEIRSRAILKIALLLQGNKMTNHKFLFPTVIITITLAHWGILILQQPLFTQLPDWFWPFIDKPPGPPWLLFLLMTVPLGIIHIILKERNQYALKLLLLILLGFSMQLGFALLEGRGIDGIRDRIIRTGHAEFAKIAVQQEDTLRVISDYEHLLESGELGLFAHSKPPGQLLLYIFTQRVSNAIHPKSDHKEKLHRFRTVASYLWPFLSYFVLIPLFYFNRLFLNSEQAILTCILYLFIPSVNLITLHTDQVFFPCFFMTCILLASLSCCKKSIALSAVTGIFIYLTLFCSFAFLCVFPFVLGTCIFFSHDFKNKKTDVSLFAKTVFTIFLWVIVSDICFRILFNYDILLRYQKAVAYHLAWKGWDSTLKTVLTYAGVNSVEYIVWIGIPVTCLACLTVFRSAKRIIQHKFEAKSLQFLILAGVLFMLIFFGRTKAEVARLWLFLVPYICTAGANELATRFKKNRNHKIYLIIFLQGGTVYLTKTCQDFW